MLLYKRGSVLGDFTIKIAKVNLFFSLPLESETKLYIQYGTFALFDTGDLWKFTNEIRGKLVSS